MPLKNYVQFILSVLIVGTGITLITQSGLGTTAVSSLPFVVSEVTPLSFGMLTMLFNSLWVILQILLLRNRFEKRQFLQFLVGPVLGLAIDGSNAVFSFLSPATYLSQLFVLFVGIAVLALGIFVQINAAAIYNPAEGLVYSIARVINRKFGDIKLTFDLVLVLSAGLLSLIFRGEIMGLREGTLLTALLVGPMVNGLQILLAKRAPVIRDNN
ncbi:YitT family protein [Alkalibacterium putridalgicola]|uniref:YczE/YyaS/YitT family protein n=1 Tax=Alkalibacterium putridalgicola TaxID=426703 RepID=UPI0034CE1B7F